MISTYKKESNKQMRKASNYLASAKIHVHQNHLGKRPKLSKVLYSQAIKRNLTPEVDINIISKPEQMAEIMRHTGSFDNTGSMKPLSTKPNTVHQSMRSTAKIRVNSNLLARIDELVTKRQ